MPLTEQHPGMVWKMPPGFKPANGKVPTPEEIKAYGKLVPASSLSPKRQTDDAGGRVSHMQPHGVPNTPLRQIRGYCLEWGYKYHWGQIITKLDPRSQFRFLPGCFNACLAKNPDIALTQDLDGKSIFARTGDGTLRIESDDVGLLVTADLADTPLNRGLCNLIDAGRVRGWSHSASWSFGGGSRTVRDGVTLDSLHQAQLTELTLVIRKYPRAKTRQTPIFLAGGPETKEAASV